MILSVSGGVIGILCGTFIAHLISGIQMGNATLTNALMPDGTRHE